MLSLAIWNTATADATLIDLDTIAAVEADEVYAISVGVLTQDGEKRLSLASFIAPHDLNPLFIQGLVGSLRVLADVRTAERLGIGEG